MSNTPRLTFAIGDIHGMLEPLKAVLDSVFEYIQENRIEDYRIVFLGDYIDRGPDSKNVVETIRQLQLAEPDNIITLRGNHELMYLEALNGGMRDKGLFRYNGGTETLKSYGVESEEDVPFSHKQFFRETRYSYQDDLRYFVHAGIKPRLPLDMQSNHDRVWIREEFLASPGPFPKYVVHGHTPRMWDNFHEMTSKIRLNLDFGVVFGGYLVCAIFNDVEVEPINYIKVGPLSRPGPL